MSYPKIISLGLGLVLISLGGWGIIRSVIGEPEVPPTLAAGSFLSLDYIQEDADFRMELARAQQQAERWRPDSQLMAISIRFDGGLDYDYLSRYTYAFQSVGLPETYFVTNPREVGTQSVGINQADLFGDLTLKEISTDYLKINFAQALEIVEQAGGSELRARHPRDYYVSLLLVQPERDVLSWVVSYRDRADQETKIWRVNAANGLIDSR